MLEEFGLCIFLADLWLGLHIIEEVEGLALNTVSSVKAGCTMMTVLGALDARLGVIFDSEVRLRKNTLMEVFTMVSPVTSLQVTSS